MAVKKPESLAPIAPIDPAEDVVFQTFAIAPPKLDQLDARSVDVSYDAPSDTLLVHLFGREAPSVAVYDGDYWFWLVNPDTEEVVGVQVEEFLSSAVVDHPYLVQALEFAELRGLTMDNVQTIRHQTLGYRGQLIVWTRQALRCLAGRQTDRKLALVEQLVSQRNCSTREPAASDAS